VVLYDKAAHDTDSSVLTKGNVLKQGSWDTFPVQTLPGEST